MKATLAAFFFLAFVSVLSPRATAQSGPPALCKPCLFYAGDFDETDPNSAVFPNENTFVYDDVKTYGAVTIPQNHSALLEGLLFQIQFDGTVKLDPNVATWEVRVGVSEGNGGILVASGQSVAHLQPTGREGNGPEYSLAVKVNPPVTINAGTYWFNVTPQCVKKNDPACSSNQYGVSNTTSETNTFRGAIQPVGKMFINSDYLGYPYTWENICDLTSPQTCARLSFGLIGKVLQ
ncbi:MAG TPA: hypothetical protein VK763_09420 [Terriglobales bacterium]|jgi:hypothetical protein|nr:hypothetical protein [Terriglobales bacterium]